MLEIKNLTKIYPNGKKAVSDLSITIEDGDLYGFIGKNGAGKTTTLKACLTIHDYDTGDILLNGVSIKSAPTECKKLMAYVPDTPILDPYLTGLQYLNFMCDIYSVSEEKRQQKIPALSKKLGMYEKLNDLISSYSHGMKQKVSLIGAFTAYTGRVFCCIRPRSVHSIKRIDERIMCVWWFGIIFKPYFRCCGKDLQ